MNENASLYCTLLAKALHPEKNFSTVPKELSPSVLAEILAHARTQKNIPLVYEALHALSVKIPPSSQNALQKEVLAYLTASYEMEAFTREITTLFTQNEIPFYLLKGMTLSSLYPKKELRRFGDVDILLAHTQLSQSKELLLGQGYRLKPDLGEHHLVFEKTAPNQRHPFIVELHDKLITVQSSFVFHQEVDQIFSSSSLVPPLIFQDCCYPQLPATENALYLLLHMLQHFLEAGFGMKMLCDWTAFLEKQGTQIDSVQLNSYLKRLHLTKFAWTVTGCCIHFLAMNPDCCPWVISCRQQNDTMYPIALRFMEDILEGGEFGMADQSRILILKKNNHPGEYVRTLHHIMKKRFPKAGRIFLLWPVLWLCTGFIFLQNNKKVRHTSTKDVLKSSRKRNRLLKQMDLHKI